jgi:predicted amidohydrolase YtcJ
VLVARAEIADRCIRDVRLSGDRIVEIAEGLAPRRDEDVFDARGCAVLPGLHDHHIHLRAAAATSRSIDVREMRSAQAFDAALRAASAERPPGAWLRVVGYHESLAGPLDRSRLDRVVPTGTPVRVQHRSGALWILNTSALESLGLSSTDEPGVDARTGHLLRRDDLLRRVSGLDEVALAELGRAASAVGITGFTDAAPDGTTTTARDLARDLRSAGVAQNLLLMGPIGSLAPDSTRASLGPVKVLLDDHALPPLDDLVATVRHAHDESRPVAIHCVTRVQIVLALAALDVAVSAAGDRIEHGSVVPPELLGPLAELGATVVTQPHFVVERGDEYLASVDADDIESLYRLRSLRDAGVAVAAGTDAPFGSFDPWASIAAAIGRTTRSGATLGADERIGHREALELYLGDERAPSSPRRIRAGSRADLCVLARPWRALTGAADDGDVRATLVAGEPVHMAG